MKTNQILSAIVIIIGILIPVISFSQQQCLTPSQVRVLPLFFVPQNGTQPSQSQKDNLIHHLKWSQERYLEMLKQRSTFQIADTVPIVYTGKFLANVYQSQTDGGASLYADELLTYFGVTRNESPYIFLVVFMNPSYQFPTGGARPINGGYNTGGGIVILSSYDLDKTPNFQSTLQHELGHSFGLPHVDVYGFDMNTNQSIMSYNPAHHTNGFKSSSTPGGMNPEDLRALALNKLCFPDFYFDPTIDKPVNYSLQNPVWLGIFDIPNQKTYKLNVFTNSGEAFGTHVENIVQHQIKQNVSGIGVVFDQNTMWQSEPGTLAVAEVHFPFSVSIDRIGVHSQHSGQYNKADNVKIETYNKGNYTLIYNGNLSDADQYISFSTSSDSVWRFSFKPGTSKTVTIRGLEFFFKDEAVFPPLIPYVETNPFYSSLPARPVLISPRKEILNNQSSIMFLWEQGSRNSSYRIQVDTSSRFCSPSVVNEVVNSTQFEMSNVLNNVTYYWRVKGRNSTGQGFGEWSEIQSVMMTNMKTSTVPVLQLPINQTKDVIPNEALSLIWSQSEYATGYDVEISKFADFKTNEVSTSIKDTTISFSPSGDSVKYYWHIRSYNILGKSAWSDLWSFTTQKKQLSTTPALLLPVNHTKDVIPNEAISLIWSQSAYTTGYEIEVSKSADFKTTVLNTTTKDTSFSFTPTGDSVIYYWHIRSYNTTGKSTWSDSWSLTTKALTNDVRETTDRSNYNSKTKLKLNSIPNPSLGVSFISYYVPEQGEVRMELFNLLGQKIENVFNEKQNAGEKSIQIDMIHRQSCTYLLRLYVGNEVETIMIEFLK